MKRISTWIRGKGGRKKFARRSVEPLTLALNRAARNPGHVVLRWAVSPACPAGQGCSAAVAPVRPLSGPGGVFEKKTRNGAASGCVRQPRKEHFHGTEVCRSARAHGLGALSAELGVSYTIQNWQNIIEAAIRQSQKALPKGETRNARLQFLSEVAKEFTYFKDGWRNYVSHNKGTYTDSLARSVMEHVRQFTTSLAINLLVASSSPASAETSRVDAGLSE